jgi:anhydro-N-acetylmuramic acid kinase
VSNALLPLGEKYQLKEPSLLITGGGAFNEWLIARIGAHLPGVNIILPAPTVIEYKEALIMALLGVLRWREEETVFSSVTGAKRGSSGGAFWMGQN